MAKAVPLKDALVFWTATVGSAVFLYYGGQLSEFLISDVHASALIRWAGVFVGVLGIVPWLVIIGLMLTVLDEYYRRVALLGTAVAFVLDLLLHVGFNIAMDAQLLGRGFYLAELPAAMATWVIGVTIGFLYYRFRL